MHNLDPQIKIAFKLYICTKVIFERPRVLYVYVKNSDTK